MTEASAAAWPALPVVSVTLKLVPAAPLAGGLLTALTARSARVMVSRVVETRQLLSSFPSGTIRASSAQAAR